MNWKIKRTVHAPVSGLPKKRRDYSMIVNINLCFSLQDNPREASNFLGDPYFEARCTKTWEQLPPHLWKAFLDSSDPAILETAYINEAAIALRVFDNRKLRKQQPLLIDDQLKPKNIHEAFAFALFDFKAPFDAHPILERWRNDVRTVIHERDNLPRQRRPQSVLLNHGYQLLNLISELRQIHPTAEEFISEWDDFKQQATIKLPLIFSIVYWGEAAYCLTETGKMPEAQTLLDKQNQAVDELLKLLPFLSEDLAGGLWRHHLGRLAYYRGDFGDALQQYCMEWKLHKEDSALKARLQRSIASILSDIGHLDMALDLAQQALEKQQRNCDPEEYKTLGRLGEIYARRGEYTQAINHFSQSWQIQSPRTREGQTAIYLGHAHLLQGDLNKAEEYYEKAKKADERQRRDFNPYLVMGQIALAKRQDDAKRIKQLWQTHQNDLDKLRNDKVLPAAVIATAVYLSDGAQEKIIDQYIEKLITENYLIEVIFPLQHRFNHPNAAPLKRISKGLNQWQQGINALEQITSTQTTNTLTPTLLLKTLATVQQTNNWEALQDYLPRIYPMNLVLV
ncbi:MAG: tetratricopeptide repeat protein [Pseudomonadota bacterium]